MRSSSSIAEKFKHYKEAVPLLASLLLLTIGGSYASALVSRCWPGEKHDLCILHTRNLMLLICVEFYSVNVQLRRNFQFCLGHVRVKMSILRKPGLAESRRSGFNAAQARQQGVGLCTCHWSEALPVRYVTIERNVRWTISKGAELRIEYFKVKVLSVAWSSHRNKNCIEK